MQNPQPPTKEASEQLIDKLDKAMQETRLVHTITVLTRHIIQLEANFVTTHSAKKLRHKRTHLEGLLADLRKSTG